MCSQLSEWDVSSSLLSVDSHGRFEWDSYCNYQQKHSVTTKLHCNQQKEARVSGFCQRRVRAQEDKEQRCLCGYDVMADFPEHGVKQYDDLAALK